MKPLITLLVLMLGSTLFADANTDWVDAQVKAIKPPRSGVNRSAVFSAKNPFLYQPKKTKGDKTPGTSQVASNQNRTTTQEKPQSAQPLKLVAVMNNSALINGTWYKMDETVRGYRLKTVKPGSVLLEKGSSKKILFVTNANENIQIQVK